MPRVNPSFKLYELELNYFNKISPLNHGVYITFYRDTANNPQERFSIRRIIDGTVTDNGEYNSYTYDPKLLLFDNVKQLIKMYKPMVEPLLSDQLYLLGMHMAYAVNGIAFVVSVASYSDDPRDPDKHNTYQLEMYTKYTERNDVLSVDYPTASKFKCDSLKEAFKKSIELSIANSAPIQGRRKVGEDNADWYAWF